MEFEDGAASCLVWDKPHAPRLIFSHATGFNAATYRSLLTPLAQELDVLAGDSRGHGFSTLPVVAGSAVDWTVFRDDLATLIEQANRGHAILAGHSMGATVSLKLAAFAPALVRGLVLIEPVLLDPQLESSPNPLAQRASQRRSVFPSREAMIQSYRGRGVFATWPEDVLRDYVCGGTIPNTDGTVRLACPPEWEAEIYRSAPVELWTLAKDVSCPLTILCGTVASSASPAQLAAIRRARPDARIVEVKGASHFLPMEQPDRVWEEVRRMA